MGARQRGASATPSIEWEVCSLGSGPAPIFVLNSAIVVLWVLHVHNLQGEGIHLEI